MTDTPPITVDVTATFTALVYPEPEAGGYSAEIPALPGCYTQGETLDEVAPTFEKPPKAGRPRPTTTLST